MVCWAEHRHGYSRHWRLRAIALAGTSALAVMLAIGEARAEPVDWVGDALKEDPVTGFDVPDDAWNNPDNWTPKKIPTGDDEVTVSVNGEPTGVMIDGGAAIAKSLTITGTTVAGAALTVRNGATLTVDGGDGNGTIDLRSYLVIGNNIFGTGGIAPGTVDASVLDIASTGVLVFDHNDTSGEYAFAPWISGDGGIEVLSGSTRLTGLNIYNGGTEIKALATLRGDSNSLIGGIEGESLDFGGTIFASNLIIGPGGFGELRINTDGGVVAIQSGDFIIPTGASVRADRLVIDSANVTVAAGATLGSGQPSFVASSRFEGGGLAETLLINSQVSFGVGSNLAFGGAWNLQFVSGLILDLDNDANFDNAVISGLSGDSHSGLEVREGTTLNIFSNGDAGTFGSALVGEGTILKSGPGSWTVQQNSASTFSGTLHVGFGATVEGLPILENGRPAAGLELAGLLLVDEEASAYVAGTVGSADISGNWGIYRDGTPGTLAVTGNMILNPMSVLTMNLGAPGGLPGLDSDLITLGGDLTLDGVLLVEDAGGFGFGLYRLFEYGGALTDNSLEIVGIPAGFSIFDFNVSTIHRGTVNLLVGDVGGGGEPPEIAMFPADDDNWQPGDFDPATTVIFEGEGREITLPGEVSLGTGGIQFADDGFTFAPGSVGGHIVLFDDPFGFGVGTPVRVGDGTAAGADFTGTIGVDITGLGGLTKTDLGTLVLTGNSEYTGGTRIEAGTVQGTTESLRGAIEILSGATAAFTGVNGTFAGALRGEGEVTMDYTERMTLATDMVATGLSMGIRVGDVLVVPGDTLGTVRFEKVTIDGPASLTVGQGATVEVLTLEGAPGSLVAFQPGSVLVVEGESILDEIAGEDSTLKVVAALTMAGNSPDYTGTIEVLDGGTLGFSWDQDGSFGGRVTGAGNVVKDGDGTLELFFGFDPAFSGGVTVAAGNLSGDGGSLNGDFDILSGGTLTFRQVQDGVFSGSISGAGNVVKSGDGALQLLLGFDPAFSGGVTVAAGALGGHAGNLPGDIEVLDGGTLQFFQALDGVYSGTVIGGGTLGKKGEGEVTIETTSAWSRVLVLDIGEGDVRVVSEEPGGIAGFDGVSIAGGSVLTVGSDTTAEVGALNGAAGSKISLEVRSTMVVEGDSILDEIEGDGLLDVRGNVTLAGDSPEFAGDIDVADGGNMTIYAVYGSTADLEENPQRMRLGQGAGLAGFGYWLGEVVLESGATVSPGNSIGTLTVGEVAFNAGSTFEIELSAGGNAAGVHNDLLAVTGAAIIGGGTVHVTPENGTDTGSTYTPRTIYTILTAAGGVSGTFDTLIDDYAFLNFALSYDANRVFLTSSLADLCLTGFTANQCAVADAIETLGTGALFTAVTNLAVAEAPIAMNRLSGEIHAAAATALVEDSRFAREATLARLRVALDSVGASRNGMTERQTSQHFTFWGQAFGAWGDWTGNGNAADIDRSIGGFFVGGDAAIEDTVRLGVFGGYHTSDFDIDDRSASGKSEAFTFGAYGGGQWGPVGLRLGAAYGWSDVETKRMVAFTAFSDSLSASRGTRLAQVHADAGYRIDVASASFEPFANLAYVHLDAGGFTETGGEAALMAADQNMDTIFATAGVRGEVRVALGTTEAALHGMTGWRHAFDDATPVSMPAFATGGDAFTVVGTPIAEDAFVLEAGLDVKLTQSATLGLGYSGQFGSGATDHGVKAHFGVRF